MKSTRELETRRLQDVAREYRKKGYEVILHPSKNDLPEFLSSYEVDMIARSKEETVIVEIKTQSSLAQADYMQSLADKIQKHTGWRFELVVTNPKQEPFPEEEYQLLSELDLMKRIGETRQLLAEGHKEAALLLAWATAEGSLRLLAHREGVPLERRSPAYMMKYLASLGLIESRDYDVLQNVLDIRNKAVHGFRMTKFNQRTFDTFLETIKKLLQTRGDLP